MIYSFPAPHSSGADADAVFDIFPHCMKLLSGGRRGPFSATVIKIRRQLGAATESQEQRESGCRETAGNSLLIVHAETVFISVPN